MAKKTNINNLNIVWRGQSWSVIAPSGDVVGRFKEKYDAIRFADMTKDYSKVDSQSSNDRDLPLPFDGNSMSTPLRFDGELNTDEGDLLSSYPNVVFEKSKRMPQSPINRLLSYKWTLVTLGMLLIFGFVAKSSTVDLTRMTSNVFSASNIFLVSDTVPFLGIVAIFIPFVMLGLSELLSGTMRNLLGIPLTLFGILGLVAGVIAGIICFVISIFSADDDTRSIVVVTLLWLWISFCMAYLGTRIIGEKEKGVPNGANSSPD